MTICFFNSGEQRTFSQFAQDFDAVKDQTGGDKPILKLETKGEERHVTLITKREIRWHWFQRLRAFFGFGPLSMKNLAEVFAKREVTAEEGSSEVLSLYLKVAEWAAKYNGHHRRKIEQTTLDALKEKTDLLQSPQEHVDGNVDPDTGSNNPADDSSSSTTTDGSTERPPVDDEERRVDDEEQNPDDSSASPPNEGVDPSSTTVADSGSVSAVETLPPPTQPTASPRGDENLGSSIPPSSPVSPSRMAAIEGPDNRTPLEKMMDDIERIAGDQLAGLWGALIHDVNGEIFTSWKCQRVLTTIQGHLTLQKSLKLLTISPENNAFKPRAIVLERGMSITLEKNKMTFTGVQTITPGAVKRVDNHPLSSISFVEATKTISMQTGWGAKNGPYANFVDFWNTAIDVSDMTDQAISDRVVGLRNLPATIQVGEAGKYLSGEIAPRSP